MGSVLLLLLGTQWYILFNVIAGAMAIPTDLKEAASVFKFTTGQRWRRVILPGIFPYLITGLVTASGGAWNASIVAEYFRLKDQTLHHGRPGRHHLARHRLRQLRPAAGLDHRDVDGRRHRESPGVAQTVPPRVQSLHAGSVEGPLFASPWGFSWNSSQARRRLCHSYLQFALRGWANALGSNGRAAATFALHTFETAKCGAPAVASPVDASARGGLQATRDLLLELKKQPLYRRHMGFTTIPVFGSLKQMRMLTNRIRRPIAQVARFQPNALTRTLVKP